MRFESIQICNSLLEHHRFMCPTGNENYKLCTIGYLRLCANAGVPALYRRCGEFLLEIAEWCAAQVPKPWPPLNALAVNEDEKRPGDHYDLAPGCSLLTWPEEVQAAIAFRGYPERCSE